MRNLQILIALALFVSATYATSYGGYSNITIFGNQDSTACQFTLTMTVEDDQVVFTETVSDPHHDCSLQNLQFANTFRGDSLYGNITLVPTSDANIFTGILTKDDLHKFNGTACGNLGAIRNDEYLYACRFRYGDIFFHITIFVDEATHKFDSSWSNLFFPNFGTTNVNVTNGVTLLTPNNTFPHIVGLLSQSSASTSPLITDLNKNVWVTGTELASNVIDLHAILGDLRLVVIIVRSKNSPADEYIVFHPTTEVIPFPNSGTKGTIDTGIKWNTVVRDFPFCGNGCEVSFVLQDMKCFVLQTNGITTQAPPKNLRALLGKN